MWANELLSDQSNRQQGSDKGTRGRRLEILIQELPFSILRWRAVFNPEPDWSVKPVWSGIHG